MHKVFLVIAAVVFWGYSNVAQAQTDAGPEMSFEFEKHDFGDIKEGDEATIDFVFTNTGNKSLIILDVVGSCSCTASSWPKEPVLPGEKAVLTASYDTKGKSGSFNKSLTITSNAQEEVKRVFIKGNVIGNGATTSEDVEENSSSPTFDE